MPSSHLGSGSPSRLVPPRPFSRRLTVLCLALAVGPTVAGSAAQDLSSAAPASPRILAPSVRPDGAPDARPRFAPDQILVKYRGSLADADLVRDDVERALGLERLSVLRVIDVHHYRLPVGTTVASAIRALRGDARVEFVEPNWIYYLDAVPNDTFYDNYNAVATDLQKWVFDGIGADRNINAEAAWNLTTGRADVVIAVIDSGIDLDHPDMAANIWSNPGEIAGNGVDDDGNGFVDDVNGWDFQSNDNNPNPDLGDGIDNDGSGGADSNTFHGTFAASCAAGVGNNALGVAGAAWTARLMAVKIFTDDGGAFTTDIANGITYAAQNGADVANMSFGGGFSSTIQSAVNFSHSQGVVQVASAGNGNSSAQQYPASLNFVISVGASDSGSALAGGSGDIDGRASFSQYGTAAVDVVAPGADIVAAAVNSVANGSPGSPVYFIASGTSFSGPIVSGLAALVVSRARDLGATLTNDDVETIIQTTTIDLPDDPNDAPNGGSTWDGLGRVDFLAAVQAVQGGGGNNPPVANAGPNQTGLVGQVLTFDGTGSSDPDNDPLTYVWNFGDGTPLASGAVVTHAYAAANTYTVTLTVSDGQANSSDTAQATISSPGGGTTLHMCLTSTQTVPGIGSVANEDIFTYDMSSGTYGFVFDGSDVGLSSAALDGIHLLPNGDYVLSLTAAFSIPGLQGGPGGSTTVDDSDLVLFTPTTLGSTTSGVFTFYFDGSDVGLTASGEDIDGLALDAGGNLYLSTTSTGSVPGGSFADEDIVRFAPTSLGDVTSGSYTMYFDGSDVSLSSASEDINAIAFGNGGEIYLSTLDVFSVTGATGNDEDILRFVPSSLGSTTAGTFSLFFDGSAAGLPTGADICGLHVQQ